MNANEYLQSAMKKFTKNPSDPDLTDFEKLLLKQLTDVQNELAEVSKELDTVNEVIREKQTQAASIVQRMTLKQGEAQGYVNTLFKLKSE